MDTAQTDMRQKITHETWEQIKTAYIAGIGLREIARKERTKLGLNKFTAEAAEQAAEHVDKLGIARNVRDVTAIHSTLRPEDHNERGLLNIALLSHRVNVYDAETGFCELQTARLQPHSIRA